MLRRSGQLKSDVDGNSDILSLLLESPEIFDDQDIIDEILSFFLAASETTQKTTQTILSHLTKYPEILTKVRDEFEANAK